MPTPDEGQTRPKRRDQAQTVALKPNPAVYTTTNNKHTAEWTNSRQRQNRGQQVGKQSQKEHTTNNKDNKQQQSQEEHTNKKENKQQTMSYR